jgi:hypothetical protein
VSHTKGYRDRFWQEVGGISDYWKKVSIDVLKEGIRDRQEGRKDDT